MPSGERPLKTAFKPFKGAGMGGTAGLCTKWVKNGLLAALKPIHLDDARRQWGATSGHAAAGPMAHHKGAEGGKMEGLEGCY